MTDREPGSEPDRLLERALDGDLSADEARALRDRVAADAAFAARAAARHELHGYLAGVRSADLPPGFRHEVMRRIGLDADETRGVVTTATAAKGVADVTRHRWWEDWFAPGLLPRYAAVLLVGVALGSAVFWGAGRLGWGRFDPELASATIGSRAESAPAPVLSARDVALAGARGRIDVRGTDTEFHVTVALATSRPVPVTLQCGDRAPLGFRHTGEAVALTVREATVAWEQHRPGTVMARFARAGALPFACTVVIDGTASRLEVLR